jgi:hypothetical protein
MAADTPDFVDPAEDCPWRSPRQIFARYGYAPLPPSELDDRQLPGRLSLLRQLPFYEDGQFVRS